VIVPRTSGSVYASFIDGTAIKGCVYDAAGDSRWENTAGSTCVDGANQDSIATGTSGLSNNLSAVADSSGYVNLSYIDSTGSAEFRRYTTSWSNPTCLEVTTGNTYTTISLDSTTGDLYAFWIRSNHIYYKKYTSGTSTWDSSPTDWKSGTNLTNLTSNYSAEGRIFAQWTSGSSSPYTINWDILLNIPERIWLFLGLGLIIPRLRRKVQAHAVICD
jgi:hypothetical protein